MEPKREQSQAKVGQLRCEGFFMQASLIKTNNSMGGMKSKYNLEFYIYLSLITNSFRNKIYNKNLG